MNIRGCKTKSGLLSIVTRQAMAFLATKDKRRFVVRGSSVPGTLALTHKLPNGEIGHCLIQRRTKGWEISQSPDQFHATLQDLLDSMSLRFPANKPTGRANKHLKSHCLY
jgi:hypothetical protein